MRRAVDVTWRDGDWAATMGPGPGAAAEADARLTDGDEAKLAPGVWFAVMGGLALLCVVGLFFAEDLPGFLGTAFGALVFSPLAWLAWITRQSTRSRVIVWDGEGIADSDHERTRRFAWTAIGEMRRENRAAERQRNHDNASRLDMGRTRGLRPRDLWVWSVKTAQGQTLMEMVEPMAPHEAFVALQRLIEQRLPPRARSNAVARR
jgi:hypothetical protein